MNQAALRRLSAVALALACAVGSPAQETAPKPMQSPSEAAPVPKPTQPSAKAAQDAKPKQPSAKAAQDAKTKQPPAKAAQDAKPKQPPAKAAQTARTKAWDKKVKARAKADAEARARAVDVNHATRDELKKLPGITDAYADAIIAKRPYKVKADLVVKNAIPQGLYQALRKKVKVAAK